MSLDLNPIQSFVQREATPELSNWIFTIDGEIIPGQININYYQGDEGPAGIEANVRFRDVAGTPAVSGYTDLYTKIYARDYDLLDTPTHITLDSPDIPVGLNEYGPYQNGMDGTFIFYFNNFNMLAPGIYGSWVFFEIWGKNTGGVYMLVSRYLKPIQYRVLMDNDVTFSTDAIYMDWRLGQDTGSLAGPFTIHAAGSWTMFLPAGMYFSEVPGTDFENVENGVTLSGNGPATFYVSMLFFSALPVPLPSNPYTLYLDINEGTIRVPIYITVLQESGFFLEYASMIFEAYKGIQEAEPQTNHMSFPGQYFFVLPPWLTLTPGAPMDTVTSLFTVLSSDNMESGTYFFKVEIRSSATNELLAIVAVTYIVHGNIISPYPVGVNAFTLDKKFIELNSERDGTYYEMAMTVTVSEMYTMQLRELPVANFKYPLFKKKQKFNIGRTVDRLMSRMKDFSDDYEMAYLPAKVSMRFVEKSFADPTYASPYTLPDIYFIAGLDPGLTDGCCILDINTGASRVTPGSIITINYLIAGTQRVAWYKNNDEINSYMRNLGIWTDRIDVSECVEGDVFKFVIETSLGSMQKVYKLFPEGRNATKVFWENEYKLQSEMLFLGDYTLKSELEARTQTLYTDLTDVLAKLEDTKISKITINTGWLLKSDVPSIESLMRAKRAAMRIRGNWINMVPISKAITNVDNKRALISFDVEFQINRNFNEEIYSF